MLAPMIWLECSVASSHCIVLVKCCGSWSSGWAAILHACRQRAIRLLCRFALQMMSRTLRDLTRPQQSLDHSQTSQQPSTAGHTTSQSCSILSRPDAYRWEIAPPWNLMETMTVLRGITWRQSLCAVLTLEQPTQLSRRASWGLSSCSTVLSKGGRVHPSLNNDLKCWTKSDPGRGS